MTFFCATEHVGLVINLLISKLLIDDRNKLFPDPRVLLSIEYMDVCDIYRVKSQKGGQEFPLTHV